MKSIYILLTRPVSMVSDIIQLSTRDQYTHASISFESSLSPLYSFGRKYTHFPLPAGYKDERLDEGYYKKYENIPCALYEIQVEDSLYLKAKRRADEMYERVDYYRFNVLSLALCRFNITVNRKRHYFCSQFVSEVLEKSGADFLPKPPALMRPQDFTEIPQLRLVYRGSIKKMIRDYLKPQGNN